MDTPITLVTSNAHKAEEVAAALEPNGITIIHQSFDIPEIQADTVEEVIGNKIEQAFDLVQGPVMVDDAGIFFDGYEHFPGVYSRFIISSLGFDGIFKLIHEGQEAYFSSFIAYKANANHTPELFSGRCEGRLVPEQRGDKKPGMMYDNFFIPTGDTRTFAEMGVAEKQTYDHRSKALTKFINYMESQA